MSTESLHPDTVIGQRYRLRRRLGEGAMGWVWEAVHIHTHRHFALKMLKGGKAEDRKRFQREVRAAAAVRHPNVVAVHDFVELPDGGLVMVMDLLEGETLGEVLRREARIALPKLASVLVPVIDALKATHAVGIVHRDLKPDNIFLCAPAPREHGKGSEDAGGWVKVLDFGVAKLTAQDGLAARTQALTGTGSLVGTPYYMSPEQVFSERDLDPRADTWSLGVVLYEALSGVRPTEADTVGRVLKRIMTADFEPLATRCPDLPGDLATLVMRMLSPERDARPSDLTEVRAVLERYAGEGRPSFSVRVSPEPVDPNAETLASGRETGSGAPSALDSAGRAGTHRAVSLRSSPAAQSRARYFVATLVVLVGGALGVRTYLRSPPDAAEVSASPPRSPSEPTPSAPIAPTTLPTPTARATDDTPKTPSPSPAALSAQAVATANSAPPRKPPRPTLSAAPPPPPASMASTAPPPSTPPSPSLSGSAKPGLGIAGSPKD